MKSVKIDPISRSAFEITRIFLRRDALHIAIAAELVGPLRTARAPQIDSGVVGRIALALLSIHQRHRGDIDLLRERAFLHSRRRYRASRASGLEVGHRHRWACIFWYLDLHGPPHGWMQYLAIRPWKPWTREGFRLEIPWPIEKAQARPRLGKRESAGSQPLLWACHCPWGPNPGCFVLAACAVP
jgi:hypothetical protein